MYFELLQSRLVSRLRTRVRNGEVSERRIALMTGISQPHIHNVLKGARVLSPEIADLILLHMNISLTDLLEPPMAEHSNKSSCRRVPVLEGYIGPGKIYPTTTKHESQMIRSDQVGLLVDPALARVVRDPCMKDLCQDDHFVLLERAEPARNLIEADAYYAVNRTDTGGIRLVRQGMGCLYLLTDENRHRPEQWERVTVTRGGGLEVIRGRVVWFSAAPDG